MPRSHQESFLNQDDFGGIEPVDGAGRATFPAFDEHAERDKEMEEELLDQFARDDDGA